MASLVRACFVVKLLLWKLMKKKKKEEGFGLKASLESREKYAEVAECIYKALEVKVCLQGWTLNTCNH